MSGTFMLTDELRERSNPSRVNSCIVATAFNDLLWSACGRYVEAKVEPESLSQNSKWYVHLYNASGLLESFELPKTLEEVAWAFDLTEEGAEDERILYETKYHNKSYPYPPELIEFIKSQP